MGVVCNLNINSNDKNENLVVLVDYHNNKSMIRYGVACHWWNSETTSLHCHKDLHPLPQYMRPQ